MAQNSEFSIFILCKSPKKELMLTLFLQPIREIPHPIYGFDRSSIASYLTWQGFYLPGSFAVGILGAQTKIPADFSSSFIHFVIFVMTIFGFSDIQNLVQRLAIKKTNGSQPDLQTLRVSDSLL